MHPTRATMKRYPVDARTRPREVGLEVEDVAPEVASSVADGSADVVPFGRVPLMTKVSVLLMMEIVTRDALRFVPSPMMVSRKVELPLSSHPHTA